MNELPTSIVPEHGGGVAAIQHETLVNEPEGLLVGHWRNKILSAITAGVVIVGGVTAGEIANQGKAQAETITYDDLGYPDKGMACEHSPYDVTGSCANYDWGPSHTVAYNDPSEISGRGYAYRNCTDYVAWKLGQLGASVPSTLGNGGDWYKNATPSQRSVTPKAGEAAVRPTSSSDAYGHVAYIESVNNDGTITISEYNHDEKGDGDRRTGTAASMGFTEFVDFGVTPSSGGSGGSGNLSDGTFLKVNESGAIYRMVGGAPIRIYNQGALPDFHGQVTNISNDQLGHLPHYPGDTGAIIDLPKAGDAKYRFVGGAPVRIYNCGTLSGNCNGAIGVNFQALVTGDHMLARPHDGAVINIAEAGGSGIYEFVGGAPIRQFNWGAIPNFGPAVDVNIDALTNSDHMNAVPADGAAVSLVEAGGAGIYRFVGGAPVRLFNQGAIPDMPNVVNINSQSLAVSDHMNTRPSDGSVINIVEAGGSGIYEFVGGAPLRLYNWGPIIGSHMAVGVNFQTLASLDHMNAVPNNGEFIASQETGVVYRVAGGDALRLYNQGGIPGYNGAVTVNQQTFDTHDHLNTSPADGTVLEGVSSQTYWQITGGKRRQVGSQNSAVVVDEQTIIDLPVGP